MCVRDFFFNRFQFESKREAELRVVKNYARFFISPTEAYLLQINFFFVDFIDVFNNLNTKFLVASLNARLRD